MTSSGYFQIKVWRIVWRRVDISRSKYDALYDVEWIFPDQSMTHCMTSSGYFQIKVRRIVWRRADISRSKYDALYDVEWIFPDQNTTHCMTSSGYFQIRVSHETRSWFFVIHINTFVNWLSEWHFADSRMKYVYCSFPFGVEGRIYGLVLVHDNGSSLYFVIFVYIISNKYVSTITNFLG